MTIEGKKYIEPERSEWRRLSVDEVNAIYSSDEHIALPISSEPIPDLSNVLLIENEEISSASKKDCIYGGEVTRTNGNELRVVGYAGDVGGVCVRGDGTEYQLSNSTISLEGDLFHDALSHGGRFSAVHAMDNGKLTIRKCVLTTRGNMKTVSSAETGGRLMIYDSVLVGSGLPFDDEQSLDLKQRQIPFAGNARCHCSCSNSRTYFYNSTIIANGWGALSTDDPDGFVYLEANDSNVYATKSGYCAYADGGCHVVFNRTRFYSGSMTGIMAGNSLMKFCDCEIESTGIFCMMHCVMGTDAEVADLSVVRSNIRTMGESVLVKSHNACIVMKDSNIYSDCGVFLRSIKNPDPNATIVTSEKIYGINVVLENMTICGDIIHEDNEREMTIILRASNVRGKIVGNVNLIMDINSSWYCTDNSEVTVFEQIELEQIDAPHNVVVSIHGSNQFKAGLKSGGRLQADS